MHATIKAFWLPKAGNSDSDYEDAFWPRIQHCRPFESICVAVADGATETSFSNHWARFLVKSYGLGNLTPDKLQSILPELQVRWRKLVGKRPLPWYAEEKLRDGAFSSIAGLSLRSDPTTDGSVGYWEAMAIGDSCLFQVRKGELIASFPMERAEQFNSRPLLLSSVTSLKADHVEIGVSSGRWLVGDLFYLMTDALACWFLRQWELRSDSIIDLEEVQNQSDFERLIREQRTAVSIDSSQLLKNDDVTLLQCRINPPH